MSSFSSDERSARFLVEKASENHDWIIRNLDGEILFTRDFGVEKPKVYLAVMGYYIKNVRPKTGQPIYIHWPVNGIIPDPFIFDKIAAMENT